MSNRKKYYLASIVMLCLSMWHTLAHAQCNATMSCDGPPLACSTNMCFINATAKKQFERQHNCKFATKNLCGGMPIDDTKQCCGKDAASGAAKIKDRQANKLDPKFDWATYQKECPNMRQSDGKPDVLWNQCVIGEKQTPDDDYPIVKIENNGTNRPYCIDGCSTPPSAVTALFNAEIFLFKDRDNPTGFISSSFFGSCAAHDKCYQTCNGGTRSTCDERLLADNLSACTTIPKGHQTTISTFGFKKQVNTQEKCISAANRMDQGVRLGAQSAFEKRRQQYCQCC